MMPLTREQRQRIDDEAGRIGVDAEELAQIAEEHLSEKGETTKGGGGRPTNERLLIGHLPFIKVRELREIWLGLTDRIPDDEMTCGEYQIKHGGAPATTTPNGEPE